jgi:transposase
MAMIGKVLRMHRREKKSVREIVRATSLSRNTVRKYLREAKVEEPKYRREPVPMKLTPFVEAIELALVADAHRPKKERRTAKALHKEIAQAGYSGGYSRLTDFIRDWRARRGGVAIGKAYVPLTFAFGEAFQFDWSEEGVVVGGIYRRLQVSHMKLCASRAFWALMATSNSPTYGHPNSPRQDSRIMSPRRC